MEKFLEDFRYTIDTAAQYLLEISEQQSQVSAEDKWSSKQIIGHLIDSAANNHLRFVKAQFTDDLMFPGYEGDDWVRVQRYNREPWKQLVQLWRHYNLHLLHLMAQAPEQTRTKLRSNHNLDQIAFEPVATTESVTLEYFMRDYVAHLKHHLRQILDQSEGETPQWLTLSNN